MMEMATYAMRDEATEGRRYREAPHPYRLEYQRDRDRIIHTKAFRRLEKKTQVFAPHLSDHFRNRLTHTIEVTQIARTISQALGLNSNLSEALALSHDIGHPPFGHTGEKELNRLMLNYDSGFDHNLHALRIVEDFEEKYTSFRGLNLTFEVREGIVKHSRDYGAEQKSYIDISEYRLSQRPPLEAQLIDLADEIAYSSADLDDGYDSGLLDLDNIIAHTQLFRRLFSKLEVRHGGAPEKLRVSETISRLINALVSNLIDCTARQLATHRIESVEAVREFSTRLVGFDPEMAHLNQELKQFLKDALYNDKALRQAHDSARRRVSTLFEYYRQEPPRLPAHHRDRVPSLPLHRVVCDYIAGMTDDYAQSQLSHIGTHRTS
ncbi:MAG: deoxyguanosinetriphosphate triphosphohydrolase [Acidobacteriota bacterium]